MELNPNEHSILAYFPSSTKAEKAQAELKAAGLVPEPGSIQVDRVSRFGVNLDDDYNSPINNAATLSGVTIFSDSTSKTGADPLLAADPSASGMAGTGYGMAGGHAFLLTLVTAKDNVEEAVKIMKANGAQV